jgi:UDP-GlcNAc:undecaprenyl-phosphate GlcNAc-1-phosphate transferase
VRGYLIVTAITAICTFVFTVIVWKFSLHFKLYPAIRARDVHTRPTPRLGGIAIFLGIVVSMLVASRIHWFRLVFDHPGPFLALVVAALLIVTMGVADDLWDLEWYTKLAGQLLAAGILAWQGFQIVSLPIGGVLIGSGGGSLVITVLFIVLIMNAVNFIDGLDGLVTGVVLIASGIFFLYTYLLVTRTSPTDYFNLASLLMVAIVGACLGFLPMNWHPARIFMGDSGALLLGMLMGVGAVSVTGQMDPDLVTYDRAAWFPLLLPILVLTIPLIDFTMAVTRRLRAGKSPFAADRKHLHHRLLDMGHNVFSAIAVFYAWTFIISLACLLSMLLPLGWVVLGFVLGAFACGVLTYWPRLQQRWPRLPQIPSEETMAVRRRQHEAARGRLRNIRPGR